MSHELGVINAKVGLKDAEYYKKLQKMQNKTNTTVKAIAGYAAVYLSARKIFSFAWDSVEAFSKLDETRNKFSVVFASVRDEAEKTAKLLQEKYGQTEESSKRLLANTGDLFTGLGMNGKEALDLSTKVNTLAADMTSFQNIEGGVTRASEALTKAMLGEYEMAKSLGVVIQTNTARYKANFKELTEGQGYTEMQARALLVLKMATDQSKNSIDDYARTSEQFANKSRAVFAKSKESLEKFGEAFMPVANESLNLLSAVTKMIGGFNTGIIRTVVYTAALLGFTAATVKTVKWVKNFTFWTKILTKATAINRLATMSDSVATTGLGKAKKVATIWTKALTSAMMKNPWTLIAVAIAVVVAGVIAYTQSLKDAKLARIAKAEAELDSARKEGDALKQKHQAEMTTIDRLKQINGIEKLNNAERLEQASILTQLKARHKDFNAEIDAGTGKIKNMTDAYKEYQAILEKERQAALRKERDKIQKVIEEKDLHGKVSKYKNDYNDSSKKLDQINSFMNKDSYYAPREELKKKQEQAQKKLKETQAEIDALTQPYKDKIAKHEALKKGDIEATNTLNRSKIKGRKKENNSYIEAHNFSKKDEFSKKEQRVTEEYDKQVENLKKLAELNNMDAKTYASKLKQLQDIRAEKQAVIDKDKEASKTAQKERTKKQADNDALRLKELEFNKVKVAQEKEYRTLEAKFYSDGKLSKEESNKLLELEYKQKQKILEAAKKASQELTGINKDEAIIKQKALEIEMNKIKGKIATSNNKQKSVETQSVSHSNKGAFNAAILQIMGKSTNSPEMQTAKNTKKIVKELDEIKKKTTGGITYGR